MDRDYLVETFVDAYVWGYPTVDSHSVMCKQALDPASREFKAPFNQIAHARGLATPADRSIVAMNVDTPYSPMVPKLVKDADGSFTLHLQHERPAGERVGNWLPVPADDFGLTFRCYQPRAPIIGGSWQAPAVVPMKGAFR